MTLCFSVVFLILITMFIIFGSNSKHRLKNGMNIKDYNGLIPCCGVSCGNYSNCNVIHLIK